MALRKPVEIWARRAASVMLSAHFLRSRLSFSPRSRAGLASYRCFGGQRSRHGFLDPRNIQPFYVVQVFNTFQDVQHIGSVEAVAPSTSCGSDEAHTFPQSQCRRTDFKDTGSLPDGKETYNLRIGPANGGWRSSSQTSNNNSNSRGIRTDCSVILSLLCHPIW